MAPIKSTRAVTKAQQLSTTTSTILLPLARKGLTRRATAPKIQDQNDDNIQTRGKRKAEHSPIKNDKIKRSAFINLTNNVKANTQHLENDIKESHQQQQYQQIVKKKELKVQNTKAAPQSKDAHPIVSGAAAITRQTQSKVGTRQGLRSTANKTIVNAASEVVPPPPAAPIVHGSHSHLAVKPQHKPMRRISNEFNKTEESLYMSALEDISSSESMRLSGNFEAAKRRSALIQQEKLKTEEKLIETVDSGIEIAAPLNENIPPPGVEDFDKSNWDDPFQVSHYTMDIFNYLKSREDKFRIADYMKNQTHLTKWMRSLLVDWMVEVQETFELNHETLYLAVKIVDLFLCRVVIDKDKLQLLGAAALFISCKYDERTPALVDDFLYICDGAYKQDELINMEMTALRTIDFDLGIPLSYRFLRRYARCARISMQTLTLSRYILELSLMDYDTISFSDSKLASAALFIALRLHGTEKPWTPTLEYYSGYKLADFAEIVPILNAGVHRKPKGTIKTIRGKYSHKIFHEVAKVTLMTTDQLFKNNLDIDIDVSIQLDNN